ncbi:MAG: biotin--[acetyl-CoA-carboxylase] ligase [Sphaerochaetaceae bacterium]|nr:biotin--[acetyl-CoA-carboxylase] ligase [Sphaerochaetaceae bacterium]
MNIKMQFYDETESTNALLKQQKEEGATDGTVIVAWKQTEGRGRLGRSFFSPEGGIYMSMLVPKDNSMLLTAKAAVAVRRAILDETDRRCQIKWVNDIIYKGKKVCGILAESAGDSVVLGIGINFCVRQRNFPEELSQTAISLYDGSDRCDAEPMDLVNAVVKNIVQMVENPDPLWLGEYRGINTVLGKEVDIVQAGKITGHGTVTEIDNDCALHIACGDTETVLSTGEVSVRERNVK